VSDGTPPPAGERAEGLAKLRAALGALVARLRPAWSRPRVRVASAVLFLVALALAGTGWDFEPVPPGDAARFPDCA